MIQSIFFETISFWTLLILLIFWKLRCFILLGWETFNNVHSLSCIFLSCYPLRSTIQYPLLFIISLLCHRWYLGDEKWEKNAMSITFFSPTILSTSFNFIVQLSQFQRVDISKQDKFIFPLLLCHLNSSQHSVHGPRVELRWLEPS